MKAISLSDVEAAIKCVGAVENAAFVPTYCAKRYWSMYGYVLRIAGLRLLAEIRFPVPFRKT